MIKFPIDRIRNTYIQQYKYQSKQRKAMILTAAVVLFLIMMIVFYNVAPVLFADITLIALAGAFIYFVLWVIYRIILEVVLD